MCVGVFVCVQCERSARPACSRLAQRPDMASMQLACEPSPVRRPRVLAWGARCRGGPAVLGAVHGITRVSTAGVVNESGWLRAYSGGPLPAGSLVMRSGVHVLCSGVFDQLAVLQPGVHAHEAGGETECINTVDSWSRAVGPECTHVRRMTGVGRSGRRNTPAVGASCMADSAE